MPGRGVSPSATTPSDGFSPSTGESIISRVFRRGWHRQARPTRPSGSEESGSRACRARSRAQLRLLRPARGFGLLASRGPALIFLSGRHAESPRTTSRSRSTFRCPRTAPLLGPGAGRDRLAAMEREGGRSGRALPAPQPLRDRRAQARASVPRRAAPRGDAAGRLHAEPERRPDATVLPSGRARREGCRVVARARGPRSARYRGHQPRFGHRVHRLRPRRTAGGRGLQPRVPLFRRRGVARDLDPPRSGRSGNGSGPFRASESSGSRSAPRPTTNM